MTLGAIITLERGERVVRAAVLAAGSPAGAGLARAAGARVTLVDRHPYTTFQPLLYQVATGGLNPGDVTFSLRALAASRDERVLELVGTALVSPSVPGPRAKPEAAAAST